MITTQHELRVALLAFVIGCLACEQQWLFAALCAVLLIPSVVFTTLAHWAAWAVTFEAHKVEPVENSATSTESAT